MTQPSTSRKAKAIDEGLGPVSGLEFLCLRSMFLHPSYLPPSAWTEHLPFAFWMIEAHRPSTFVELGVHHGASYFAFCQAVDSLSLGTRCYAVDTWNGDEHAGFYDERVFSKVSEHNRAHYAGFSRLVRSTFDDALEHFSDGSIDLLHIDGLHTYEAILHDFSAWSGKLSPKGVVLLHDTNVRERSFGIFRLFEDLKEQYPTFEFLHGNGLGVAGIGSDQSPLMAKLFATSRDAVRRQMVQEIFSNLGRACTVAYQEKSLRRRNAELNANATAAKQRIEEQEISEEKITSELSNVRKELEWSNEKVATIALEAAGYRGRAESSEAQLATLSAQNATLERAVERALAERDRLESEAAELAMELTRREQETERANAKIMSLDAALKSDKESARNARQEREAEREKFSSQMRCLIDKNALLKTSLDERFEEIAMLSRLLLEREHTLSSTEPSSKAIAPTHSFTSSRLIGLVQKFSGLTGLRERKLLALLKHSGLFDPEWYLCNNPDVAEAKMDPLLHYLRYGGREGRDPSPKFSSSAYLNENKDVAESKMNPLAHCVLYGRQEGRPRYPG